MTSRNELQQAQYLLTNLWECAVQHRCDCTAECKSVREAKDGHWPVWGCTRGKFTLATKLIQASLPDEWPDEWDEEFDAAIKALAESAGKPMNQQPTAEPSEREQAE